MLDSLVALLRVVGRLCGYKSGAGLDWWVGQNKGLGNRRGREVLMRLECVPYLSNFVPALILEITKNGKCPRSWFRLEYFHPLGRFCLANLSTFLDSFDLSEALVKTFNLQHNTA